MQLHDVLTGVTGSHHVEIGEGTVQQLMQNLATIPLKHRPADDCIILHNGQFHAPVCIDACGADLRPAHGDGGQAQSGASFVGERLNAPHEFITFELFHLMFLVILLV